MKTMPSFRLSAEVPMPHDRSLMGIAGIRLYLKVLLAGWLLQPFAVCAQTSTNGRVGGLTHMSMEELMKIDVLSSASFFEVEKAKNPGFSQTFNADEIEVSPIRTLGDLVEMKCPSFALGGSPREGLQIGGRGITSENTWRTLLLIDGHNVNHRVHFGMLESVSTPVMGDIKRLEVVTGPGAIVHGSGAFDGFINVTPRNGTDDAGGACSLEYGFKDEFKKMEVGYGESYGPGRDVYVDAAYFTAEGFEADDAWDYEHSKANQAWATQLGNFDTKAMIRSARPYRFVDDNYRLATYWRYDNFSAHVIFGQTQQDMFSFNEQGYVHSQYLLWQAKYLSELNSDNSLEYIASGEVFDEYYLWSANTLPAFALGDKSGGDEVGEEGKLIYRTAMFQNHRIALGGSVGYRDMNSMKQFFRANDLIGPGNDATGEYVTMGLFSEDVITLAKGLTGYVGLRYDKMFQGAYQTYNSAAGITPPAFTPDDLEQVSPRVGLVYELGENDTVKLSYQKGFRFPEPAMYNWRDLFDHVLAAGGFRTLPEFKTETLESIELNYIKNFPEQRMNLSFNLFHNIYRDRLSWIWFNRDDGYVQPEGWDHVVDTVGWVGSYVNIKGNEYINGGEAVLSYDITDDLKASVGYELLDIDNRDVVRYPEQQVKVNLRSEFFSDRLTCDLYFVADPGGINNPDGVQHPIYDESRSLVNMAVSCQVRKNILLKLVAENLLEDDVPPATFNMDSPQSGHIGRDARRIYLSMITHF
jgi:outer membrane receptor for ferrienterochelin and colicin